MTLGDLKINCYKLIDPSDEEVHAENINSIYESDTAYSFYFLNMLNSINSAITRIVQACILPLKRLEIESDFNDKATKRININLGEYADDIYKVKLIEYEDKNGDASRINYRLIGSFLEVQKFNDGKYVIYYYPRIKSLELYFNKTKLDNINSLNLNEIGIDDNLLSVIPYFVKADLLEHDKPTEAVLSRNTFEQYLAGFVVEEIEIKATSKSWWRGML